MPTLADPPIANAKEATRSAPPAVSRFIDSVDSFADRLMMLVFTTGTAQAFE